MGSLGIGLGVGLLVPAALLACRHGLRQPPGAARSLGAVVLAWAWITAGAELLGGLGLLARWPLVAWSAGGLAVAAALRFARPGPADPVLARPKAGPGAAATIAVGLLIWASLRLGLTALLFPVKVVSDGPIYHLYFAARWWKAGRIFPVPSPFGEVGATYFWANGELWYAWLMTLWGGDAWARLGQVPFYGVAIAAAHALARRAGTSAGSATIASACFASAQPLLLFAFEPNVDALFIAGYLLACYFFLRYAAGDDGWASLALGALAAGLGMGTKPTGIVFFPPLIALAAVPILTRAMPRRAKLGHLATLVILPATMAGFWPARNAWLTGNPLYPLRVEILGRAWLRGWFGPDAMTRSLYYIPVSDWRSLIDILLAVLDPRMVPLWAFALLGGWAIGRRDRASTRLALGCTVLAAADLALYWLVIPYRTQQRFMLQALGLAVVPLAMALDRAAWVRWAAVAALALHLLTPQVWPIAATEREIPWDLNPRSPNVMPSVLILPLDAATLRDQLDRPTSRAALETVALLGLGAFPVAWLWLRPGGPRGLRRAAVAVAATTGLALVGAARLGEIGRVTFPGFADFYGGWTELELRSPPSGVRVAYAGTNLPYYLMGGGLRNDVRYVNVDGHPGWLMHDYHARAAAVGQPETWPDPFPNWDRLRPDYDAWLANLRAEGVDLLVVTRVNPSVARHDIADRDLFTIERGWAESHPEAFAPVYGVGPPDPKFRIYRLLPGNSAASSTDRAARSH